MKFSNVTFGVPKEIMLAERRVALNPDAAKKIIDQGGVVLVETMAGAGSKFMDDMYKEAGAIIVEDVQEIFAKSDVILKVKEPKMNEATGKHEADMMREGQTLITFIHPATPSNKDMVCMLRDNGITSFTLDGIPRITRAQTMDALTSMSTVAGYKGMLMAANELPYFIPMMSTAVGMIRPANVLVVGVGVGGLQALATAKRLGAVCYVADIRPDASEQGTSLGAKVIDLGIPTDLAVGEGGYARALPNEWLDHEREILRETVKTMDIVFLSALVPSRKAPVLIDDETLKQMKPGSVIVDISIDQGGNCAGTVAGKTIERHGVTIIGINNIPGQMPQSSTWMFANNMVAYLGLLYEDGKLNINLSDPIIQGSLVTHNKEILHAGTLESMKG